MRLTMKERPPLVRVNAPRYLKAKKREKRKISEETDGSLC
jgi:hypothetical protein